MSYTRPFPLHLADGRFVGDVTLRRLRVMKRLLTIGVVLLLSGAVAAAQQKAAKAGGGAASGDVAQALMEMENQWTKASKAGDGDAVAAMLATDFVGLDSDGSLHTKADVVARVKKAKWVTNEIGDMKVTAHGETAIVTGSWIGKGTDDTGKTVDTKERWADTWVKTNGKWQCVASASAPIK
jgi:ketosteroid isomerase-like protein